MKHAKSILLSIVALFCAAFISAQTADEIIAKYIQAVGGKEKLSAITSLYTEGKMEVMGMEGIMKSTTLNGKGSKQEMEIMGAVITTCYTDKDGWSINPMAGSTSAETMPEAQYNSGKEQIFIGAPFVFYTEKGYKAELLGNEDVAGSNAYKIKLTSPENVSAVYFFDAETALLTKTIQQAEMQGQMMENEIIYSDYRDTDGTLQPFKMEMSVAGGQFTMTSTITKVELNKPVDEAFFAKP